ncbi:MAG: helix-turn-helix transcriptional regulator, partial [Nitrospinaceae bacterium]
NFSLQEAFKVLLECKNRGALRKAIKDHIYPVFEDDFRHFVIEVSETEPPPLMGCSTLSTQDQEVIQSYLEEDPLAKLLLLQNEVSEQIYLRNENEAQTLFSFIAYKIKSVILEEALVKSRAMVQGLLKSPSGIAVVAVIKDTKNVVTSNQAFREIFDMTSGTELPQNLVKVLEREQANLDTSDPAQEPEKWGREVSFFTLPKGTYKLYLIPLEVQSLNDTDLWLLRIHPAADPFTKSNRLIEKAGLTWREMEICCLIHDGLGRNEIAERLFISAHTVKTHLKKIHKKLQVNSRTQLVAYLNQHADEAPDGGFA